MHKNKFINRIVNNPINMKFYMCIKNIKNMQSNCKGQKRAKRPKAVMDPSPRSPNNEFVESRNKS